MTLIEASISVQKYQLLPFQMDGIIWCRNVKVNKTQIVSSDSSLQCTCGHMHAYVCGFMSRWLCMHANKPKYIWEHVYFRCVLVLVSMVHCYMLPCGYFIFWRELNEINSHIRESIIEHLNPVSGMTKYTLSQSD